MDETNLLTVTEQDADLPLPSLAVALIVTVPFDMALTCPFWLTVATETLLDDHVTDLSLAFSGDIDFTDSVAVCPSIITSELLSSVIPVTYCLTSTWQDAHLPLPSFAVAVIVAVPLDTPVTIPEVDTDAIVGFELSHFIPVSLAVEGLTVAVRVWDLPL